MMVDALTLYAERNALAVAFAWTMNARGHKVGVLIDPDEPDWPVLMVDTPEGQVSWHMTRQEIPDWVPIYDGEWDGHTTEEKYRRMRQLTESAP